MKLADRNDWPRKDQDHGNSTDVTKGVALPTAW